VSEVQADLVMCERYEKNKIYAVVVTRVAGSLETVGLPGYPEVLFVEINVMKSCQSFVALYFTQLLKTQGLKLYAKCLHANRGTCISVA
jgi:hypothetical protein